MASLNASEQGQAKIKQARKEKGWKVDDHRWLVEASNVLEPSKVWPELGPYADGCSEGTWKRFLYKREGVDTDVFKAFCTVLGLPWEEIVDRTDVSQSKSLKPTAMIAPDWRQLCLTMLERKRQLTVDYWLNGADRLPFEQLDFAPLGLLQQKKDQTNRSIGYAVTESFDTKEKFFDEVLRDGKNSPKSQGRRLAIIGESGAGKTTLLLKIGFWMLEHTDEIPLWIDGRKIGKKPLHQYLKEWLQAASGKLVDLPPEWIANLEQRLEEGRICLLMDGVEKQGTDVREQLTDWGVTDWGGKCRVVLTCRTSIWNTSKDPLEVLGFDIYQNLGFGIEQIKQCIDAWFANDAEDLWAELNQPRYHRIKNLVSNPLYLTFLCRTWQPKRQLPSTKAGLIQWFLNTDYDRSIPESKKPQKQALINSLEQLAKQAIERGEYLLSHSLVCSKLGESDEDLFKLAINQLGWLQRVSPYSEEYEFLHDSFKEYFAAKAIPHRDYFLKHIPQNPNQGTYLIFDPKWKEVILLWLGREDVDNEEKEKFIKLLVEFEDGCQDFYFYRACCLAASAIAEFKECRRNREIVLWLVRLGFSSQTFDAPSAQLARETLIETDRTLAVTILIDTINNRLNLCVGYLLVWALGQIGGGSPEAISTLLSLICTSTPDATHYECNSNHYQAIDSLAQIAFNDSESIKVISDLIDSNTDMLTRVKAANCLVEIAPSHKSKAINTLIELMDSEQNADIRCRAAYSLAKIDSQYLKKAVETLSDIIDSYNDFNPNNLIHHLTASRLIELADKHPKAIALAPLLEITSNYPESITELIDLIGSSSDSSISVGAAKKLEEVGIGNYEAVKILIELIHSNIDSSSRFLVAECLGKILQTHQFELAISSMKDCLCDQIAESDFNLYYNCYKAIWPCAQNMSYPEFFRVWHGEPQSHKWELFPQDILRALSTDSQLRDSVKLICIDGNKFIERDNPSGKIYSEMVKHGCSKSDDGIPKTMLDLQTYWDLLDSEKQMVLVLYENHKGTEPKDFSKCFLDAISKFDGLICVVSSKPEDNLLLKQFSSHDPNLIENIIKWIEASLIESL
ncbi:NACHT C-terminal alpha/beta 1 domain-containing protein [Planktothrix mougeotii]|uniref:HEAT repeat domain-containing protein n=1 Tax=Planktothrix mougeotii LEGE 06226 TaxID=1828728 RepID=A0ABR9UE38_9CYAN|nr:HEAT repeat domain-containing protein [Planktothrix mougeotii]MBE9144720.1 HEAT repeat domain-containing protein [Planktothrix mougeotii LEGE 06226]